MELFSKSRKLLSKNYIDTDMWNLNKIDYDDDNMEKGYKFHNDNQIPNYDNSLTRPQNLISVPIYKGLQDTV